MKRCTECRMLRPESDFPPNGKYLRSICRPCFNSRRRTQPAPDIEITSAADLDCVLSDMKRRQDNVVKGGKPIKEITPGDGEWACVVNDIHFGIEHKEYLEMMMEAAVQTGVTLMWLDGDIFDCYAISRHPKQAARIRGECFTLDEEKECGKWFLKDCASMFDTTFIPGNHDDRLIKLEDDNPGMHGSLSIRKIFEVPDEIDILPQFGKIQAGSLAIEHGHKLPGSLSSYGAAKVLRDHPDQTTIYGHVHRFMYANKTSYDRYGNARTRACWSNGHMSRAEKHMDYAPDANWQNGFMFVEFWYNKQGALRYTIYPIEFHDDEFRWDGKTYR